MSESTFDSNDQLQEPSGADAYVLENLRERILHKIEGVQDAATLRKVWSLLTESPADQKPLQLSRHAEAIFNQYHETLTKLAQ
jgi:hypothetical protein